MELQFRLTPMFFSLGACASGRWWQSCAELGTKLLVWGTGTQHSACLTPIPWLPVPPWETSPQMLKGASGQVFPWVNTLIY